MDTAERRKRASEQAAHWFVRLKADDLPRATREEYIDWLRDSPTHVAEMIRVAQVHGSLEQFEHWTRIGTEGPDPDGTVVPIGPLMKEERAGAGFSRERARHWKPKLFVLAAAVAGMLVVTSVLVPRIRGQIVDTARGERREVVLSDGSVVQVDPQTYLRIKFNDDVRQVYLKRGRALFHVAKNRERPFLVQAGDTVVRAVGTAFGVERQREGLVVTVSEGKVAVLAPSARGIGHSDTGAAGRNLRLADEKDGPEHRTNEDSEGSAQREDDLSGEVLLTANQQITVQRSGSAEVVRRVDSARELSWAEGRLIFENDRVSEVIQQFNRYNRVQLQVTDEALATRPISGVFSASDPESFVAFIQTVAPVRVERGDNGDIIISPSHAR